MMWKWAVTALFMVPSDGKTYMLRCPRAYRYSYTLNLSTRMCWVIIFTHLWGKVPPLPSEQETGWAPQLVWTFWKREKPLGPTGNPSSFLNCPAFNLVIIQSTLMQVVSKMMRNLSHSSLCCSWHLKWALVKYMSDALLHEPTCPKKTLHLARRDDYDWWLHMFRKHSATGILAIFQAGCSLAENWLI